jgi:cytochrome P450
MSSLPPGPRSALLQTFAVVRDPFGTFQKYARRYGDPFTLTLCTGPIVLTGTPEGVREILTAPPQSFASNSAPCPDDLVQLPYLRAVCEEALRLYPVVGAITRRLRQPMTLRGYRLPAGIAVGVALPLMHLDPTRYPDPQCFRPERFLERPHSPYEYLPFGGGARRCVGAAFAVAEMKIALGSLLARHRFGLVENTPVPPVPRTFTIGPKGGVRMIYHGPAAGETVGEASGGSPTVGYSPPVAKSPLQHEA